MSAESFLNAPCEPWRDDPDDPPRRDEPTWRDWLKDILVTFEREKEGFQGKRPNCCTNWQCLLPWALKDHGVTMAEVVVYAFDTGLEEPHRLHEPGHRTREAFEGFHDWAVAQGALAEVVDFAKAVHGPDRAEARIPRGGLTLVREALAQFETQVENSPSSPNPRFDCNWPGRVERYLDEVSLDAWKRTDVWRPQPR